MGGNWVFVDYRVEDRAVLLAGLGADCEWRLVGPDEDGLRQIRVALGGQRDVASIRIVAHGWPGTILLGAAEIDGDTLARRNGELAEIGQALAAGGDLQIYGCAVGDGEAGRAFVDALAEGLGVPVAASSTPVGHADLGGDWRLDVGELRTKPLAVPQWRGVLGLTVAGIPLRNTPERTTWEYRNENAFAVIRTDGSVVTWGYPATGGNSSGVADQLDGTIDVVQIFHGGSAFAALRADGSVVTWGDTFAGGNSSSVAGKLDGTIDVTRIASNFHAFAALRADGSVVTWGHSAHGGDPANGGAQPVPPSDLDGTIPVTQLASTVSSFVVLRADGSVVTWGEGALGFNFGGNSSAVADQIDGTIPVTQVFGNDFAFAALRVDGSVITWGGEVYGASDTSRLAPHELDGTIPVVHVFASQSAFAALRADGSVVSWGTYPDSDTGAVTDQLDGTVAVTSVSSTAAAFAALRADGSVVTWGYASYGRNYGQDSSAVADEIDGTIPVTHVFANAYAFAALRAGGSVVTWGLVGIRRRQQRGRGPARRDDPRHEDLLNSGSVCRAACRWIAGDLGRFQGRRR